MGLSSLKGKRKVGSSEGPSWVVVGTWGEILREGRKLVRVGGREVALFGVEGKVYAIGNRCPHRGGPLIRGYLEGCAVRCPMHGWRFHLETGLSECPARARVYEVREEDGRLYLRLNPP